MKETDRKSEAALTKNVADYYLQVVRNLHP